MNEEKKKKKYDQFGHQGFDQRYSQEDIFKGVNFDDIFKDIFGGAFGEDESGGDLFSMFFGGGRRRRRGQDLRYDLEISFEEAAFGCEKKLKIPRLVKCEHCEGTGAEHGSLINCENCDGKGRVRKHVNTFFGSFMQVTTCRKCNGYGKLAEKKCRHCNEGVRQENKEIKIEIPGGVDSGSRIRVSGGGEAIGNGESGDLYIFIHVGQHEIFERNDVDIIVNYPISFSQAALGDAVEIPTLKDKIKIKIPAGTQSNTIFRLRGKGIKMLHDEGYGDELVRIIVKTPTKLSRKQEDLLSELAGESKEKLKIEKGFFEKVRDVFL